MPQSRGGEHSRPSRSITVCLFVEDVNVSVSTSTSGDSPVRENGSVLALPETNPPVDTYSISVKPINNNNLPSNSSPLHNSECRPCCPVGGLLFFPVILQA